ncbi:MAG TPA: YcxB family protein [Candidatus Acidoferrales bacterium]|nr:YcxB family protein [Candidatus Acidoferrales bacterium]
MSATVSLTFRYQQGDYARAMRAHYVTRLWLWLDLPVIAVVGGLGLYLWRSAAMRGFGIFLVSIAIAFALVLIWAFFVMPIWIFRSQPKFMDEYQLTFSPAGIHFHTAHIDSELQWKMYTRALVDGKSYVLYYGSQTFTLVPKRVFESDEQRDAFEKLLTQNVKQIVRKGK